MAGHVLAEQGHQVVLHVRDKRRAGDAKIVLAAAADVVVGDASHLKDLQRIAEQLNGMDAHAHGRSRHSTRYAKRGGLPLRGYQLPLRATGYLTHGLTAITCNRLSARPTVPPVTCHVR
jgi:hypothetical protein